MNYDADKTLKYCGGHSIFSLFSLLIYVYICIKILSNIQLSDRKILFTYYLYNTQHNALFEEVCYCAFYIHV